MNHGRIARPAIFARISISFPDPRARVAGEPKEEEEEKKEEEEETTPPSEHTSAHGGGEAPRTCALALSVVFFRVAKITVFTEGI